VAILNLNMTSENTSPVRPQRQTRLRVRYAETDQMGVVYYANYYVWMEIGRVELVRSLGMNYKSLEESEGLFLAVIESNCRYLRPARYDQEIIIDTEVASTTPRIVEFKYRILSEDPEQLLAEGSTKHMWLSRDWRPARLPERYMSLLGLARMKANA
jgi:acyl-CoA thioester hydrolase